MSTDVYVELRRQIDKMPVGMPATDSGVEIRILKHLFTPEEAKIALHLNAFPESLERVHGRLKKNNQTITLEELRKVLDRLVAKGSILSVEKDNEKFYNYAPFVFGMYEFQVDRLTREFYEDSEEYVLGEFRHEFFSTNVPQFRVVPVEKSILVEHHVATYDEIRSVIKNTEGQFGVMNCICRQGKDLTGHKCQTTDLRETCITFPSITPIFLKFGSSRPITKDEALELLQRAEDEGLVIQPSNTQEPFVMCCCCGDCCGVLTSAKKFPKPATLFATNYHAEVNQQLCSGCGTCIQRCQMEAPTIVDDKSSISLDRCIGCGLCVPTCPSEAIMLVKKEKETVPPKAFDDLYKRIMLKKVGYPKMLKIGFKKILGQKV